MRRYVGPKSNLRSAGPRSLTMAGKKADFTFVNEKVSAWSGTEESDTVSSEGER
jgi:hypothetical protein